MRLTAYSSRIGRKTVLGAVGVLAALGAGGTAFAATSSSSSPAPGGPTPPAASSNANRGTGSGVSPAAPATGARKRSLLDRADHASVEVKVKGQWITYDVDRGKVTAVSPGSITLQRPDGQSVTETLGPDTKYKGVTSESGIRLARPAMVVSEGGTAVRVRQAAQSG